MNLRSATLLLTALCLLGCGSKTEQPDGDPSQPKPNGATLHIRGIEKAPKLTEGMLQEFETKQQCKLPDDYRRFLLQNNGGFPTPDCVTFQEAGRKTAADVLCFHAIGDTRPWADLEWHLKTFAGRLPKNTLPIGHDSCGNLWLLNVGPEHHGSIAFWDHGSFDNFDETDFAVLPRVAESFQKFIDGLHKYEPLPDEKVVMSRYALVEQAVAAMAKKSADFNKHSAPDFAWHCHFANGNATMQFVKYEVHAVATHTDGYSDLRAAKGVIKAGPARLPQ